MVERASSELDEPTRTLLLEQFAVEQLLLGLALVDGFLLDVVVVPTPRVARSLLALIREELPKRREERLLVRVLAPDPSKASALAPVEPAELLEDVFAPMLRPERAVEGAVTLTWVDASTARDIDDPAWTTLFFRLNERRNAVTAAQPGPLVFVIPPRLESVFAHAAPDAWSVRSGVHRVQLSDLESHPIYVDPARRPSLVPSAARRDGPRYLTLSMGLQSEAPARFDDQSRAWVFAESVSDLLARGELDEAEEVSEQALRRARAVVAAAPESIDALRLLAKALEHAADVAIELGELQREGELEAEGLRVAGQLCELGPSTAAHLSMRARARKEAAYSAHDGRALAVASVDDARVVVSMSPSLAESKLLLADCLTTLGELELNAGDASAALPRLEEAFSLFGTLGRTSDAIHTQVIAAHALRAKTLVLLGRRDEALAYARAAVELVMRARQLAPRSPAVMRFAVQAHEDLASVFRAVGDLARAEGAIATARQIAYDMVRRWPQSLSAVGARARVLRESAELAHERGLIGEARSHAEEALALCDKLLARAPEEPDFTAERETVLAFQKTLAESADSSGDATGSPPDEKTGARE